MAWLKIELKIDMIFNGEKEKAFALRGRKANMYTLTLSICIVLEV